MLFILCLNLSAFTISEMNVWPIGRELAFTPASILNSFSVLNLLTSIGVAGGVGTIIGLTFGFSAAVLGGMLIWAIVSFSPIIREFLIGVPLTLEALLPPEAIVISLIIQAVFAAVFFLFIIELASQRRIT